VRPRRLTRTALALAACSAVCACASGDEVARVASPDGRVEAVLFETNGGPTPPLIGARRCEQRTENPMLPPLGSERTSSPAAPCTRRPVHVRSTAPPKDGPGASRRPERSAPKETSPHRTAVQLA